MGKRVKPEDYIGKKFGRLTITDFIGEKGRNSVVAYRCDCGKQGEAAAYRVKIGETRSCGCLHKESLRSTRAATGNEEHGMFNTPEYNTWTNMKERCFNEKNTAFRYYGARGVTVCDKWKKSFTAFFKDMGERPEGHSIDRIDPAGNYEQGNCRWTDRKTQARNKRGSVFVTYKGERVNFAELIERTQAKYVLAYSRIFYQGMPVEEAIEKSIPHAHLKRMAAIRKANKERDERKSCSEP